MAWFCFFKTLYGALNEFLFRVTSVFISWICFLPSFYCVARYFLSKNPLLNGAFSCAAAKRNVLSQSAFAGIYCNVNFYFHQSLLLLPCDCLLLRFEIQSKVSAGNKRTMSSHFCSDKDIVQSNESYVLKFRGLTVLTP